MYVYDSQTTCVRQLPDTDIASALFILGYTGAKNKVLSGLAHSLTGLNAWPADQAPAALEARLYMHRSLLLKNGTVHDIRTHTYRPKLLPAVNERHSVAVKCLIQDGKDFKEHRFIVSTHPFDAPAPSALNEL